MGHVTDRSLAAGGRIDLPPMRTASDSVPPGPLDLAGSGAEHVQEK